MGLLRRPIWTDISESTSLKRTIWFLNRRLSGLGMEPGDPIVIEFNIGEGNGPVVSAGDKMELSFPDFGFDITGWQLTAKPATTCTLDLWRKSFGGGLPLVADTIITAGKPALVAAVEAAGTAKRWTPRVMPGSKLTLNVDVNTLATRINLALSARKL